MRIAALFDIHGNLPALEAVLADVEQAGVDHVVVGGDVLPGPLPREALQRLQELPAPAAFIQGNGEAAVLAQLAGREPDTLPPEARPLVEWVAQQLGPEEQQMIAGWPLTVRLPVSGLGEVLFCHATPRSNTELFTRQTAAERLLPIFADVGAPLVVCGHTHMQFDRTVGSTRIVNAGSVGMPFGEAGAHWLLLGPEVSFQHTAYDLAAAAAQIRSTAYPQADIFSERVLQPASQAEMLAAFSKIELRE